MALRKYPVTRTCPICNKTFNTNNGRKYYCSKDCGDKASTKRLLEAKHKAITERMCQNCGKPFKPARFDSVCCSVRCYSERARDIEYFNGKRKTAVGFKERTCWICRKYCHKINVHHVMGRAISDEPLTVLCPGCHDLLTKLACRVFLCDENKVADLITLARYAAGLDDARTEVKYYLTVKTSGEGK